MLVDANLLIYAVDEASTHHTRSREWLTAALNGEQRVGLPWLSLAAFLRITTNPRASERPLSPSAAWAFVQEWLDHSADTDFARFSELTWVNPLARAGG